MGETVLFMVTSIFLPIFFAIVYSKIGKRITLRRAFTVSQVNGLVDVTIMFAMFGHQDLSLC